MEINVQSELELILDHGNRGFLFRAGMGTEGKNSLQIRLKVCFISLIPCTSQERRTTGTVDLPYDGN